MALLSLLTAPLRVFMRNLVYFGAWLALAPPVLTIGAVHWLAPDADAEAFL